MDREAIYRRTIRTLMTSNGFGFGGFLAVFAVIGLLTSEMTGSDRLAGVPVAASTLGSAIAAAPLALRSRRRGRRFGLGFGYIVAIAGGAVAFLAAQAGLFWLLVAAMVFFGVGNASNLQHRFAAADLADDDKRGRAIGSVVWVGTIGAVLGAPAALWVNRIGKGFGLGEWVSPMLLGIAGYVIALAVVTRYLRPDPLEVSGALEPDAPRQSPLRGLSQSLSVVWPNPHARLALVAMVASQVAMVAVMTMTPLHMKDHGHAELSTIVIGAHVVGMYALAPVIGRWADRFGRIRSLRWGAAILGTGTIAAVTAGYVPALVFVGLFLLGLGWSFALIGGSALLTESLRSEDRLGAQGLTDVLMAGMGTIAALASGFVKQAAGFHWLANVATITVLLVLIAATRAGRTQARLTA